MREVKLKYTNLNLPSWWYVYKYKQEVEELVSGLVTQIVNERQSPSVVILGGGVRAQAVPDIRPGEGEADV